MLDTNVKGLMVVTAVSSAMVKANQGHINMGSTAGIYAYAGAVGAYFSHQGGS